MAWKKKCPSCANKINKKYSFCPNCGHSFKQQKEQDDFGLLGRGRDDFFNTTQGFENPQENIKLPMGLNKIMNSLMKQLEKQMKELDKDSPNIPGAQFPRGFKIQISTGRPKIQKIQPTEQMPQPQILETKQKIIIPQKELERRKKLPIKEAESKVRRLADKIIYEISTPGVKNKTDIVITKLENSIEIKAYSKNSCYIKTIPLKVEIVTYYIKDEKLVLELKS